MITDWLTGLSVTGANTIRYDAYACVSLLCRHDLDDLIRVSKEEILWANRWMKQTLSRYFPSTPTVFSIGNHDVFPAGSIDGLSAGLSGLAEAWEIEEKSFKDGGYWAVDVDVNGKASALTVISLNTLAFSRGNQFARDCQHPRSLGAVHLEWLRKQLQRVEEKKRNALVVGHVPALPDFYHPTCLQEYNRLLYRHRHGVVAQLFGHVHQDFFFVSRHKAIPSVPALIAPALAPVFNPAYRILQFASSSDGDALPLLHHWEQYYAPAWNCSSAFPHFRLEYNSSSALQMSTVSIEALLAVLKEEDAQCSSSSTTRRLMLERFRRVCY